MVITDVGDIGIGHTTHQTPVDKVNYLFGFNWTINERWWVQSEDGFGVARNNIIARVT